MNWSIISAAVRLIVREEQVPMGSRPLDNAEVLGCIIPSFNYYKSTRVKACDDIEYWDVTSRVPDMSFIVKNAFSSIMRPTLFSLIRDSSSAAVVIICLQP